MAYVRLFITRIYKIFQKRPALLLILVLLLGALSYAFFKSTSSSPRPPMEKVVEVVTITPASIKQTTRLLGTIRPKHATVLITKTSGTLDYVVPAGQTVKKGTLIAKIENADLEASYKLSESAEDIAKKQYERTQTLLKSGNVSTRMLEDQKNTWIEAQKRLAETRIQLDKTRFFAPFDGIVGVFKTHEGSQLEAGEVVVTFYDPSHLMVEFDIPDSLIQFLHEGQSVIINEKVYPLTHFQRMIDNETHMCPAYVDISCETCLIGTSVPVDLIIQNKKDTIVIPYGATFIREGKLYVYRVEDNKAALTPITLGIREKEMVEVTEGLKVGDVIISVQPQRLYPTCAVKVDQPKPTPNSNTK